MSEEEFELPSRVDRHGATSLSIRSAKGSKA